MRAAVVLIIVLEVLGLAWTFPTSTQNDQENCLVMTPKREKQINDIVEQIAEYISNISNQYQDINIKYVSIDIEKPSKNQTENAISLSVIVNDCSESNENDDTESAEYVSVPVESLNNEGSNPDYVLESKTDESSSNGDELEVSSNDDNSNDDIFVKKYKDDKSSDGIKAENTTNDEDSKNNHSTLLESTTNESSTSSSDGDELDVDSDDEDSNDDDELDSKLAVLSKSRLHGDELDVSSIDENSSDDTFVSEGKTDESTNGEKEGNRSNDENSNDNHNYVLESKTNESSTSSGEEVNLEDVSKQDAVQKNKRQVGETKQQSNVANSNETGAKCNAVSSDKDQSSQTPNLGLKLPKGMEVMFLKLSEQEERMLDQVQEMKGTKGKPFLLIQRKVGDKDQLMLLK